MPGAPIPRPGQQPSAPRDPVAGWCPGRPVIPRPPPRRNPPGRRDERACCDDSREMIEMRYAFQNGTDGVMMWARHKAVIIVAAVVVLAGLVAGALVVLSSGGQAGKAAAPAQLRSPFTGEAVASLNRVLAVKIDNIVHARPQTGLDHADIVYVLPVEGGLSRFLAIFSSGYPPVVGPVRSAREDDLELLRQFGRPAFAYSGATATLLPYIHRTA